MRKLFIALMMISVSFCSPVLAAGNDGHLLLGDGSKIWIAGSHKKPGKRAYYRTENANGKLTSCKKYNGSEDKLRASLLKKKGGSWIKGSWPSSIHC